MEKNQNEWTDEQDSEYGRMRAKLLMRSIKVRNLLEKFVEAINGLSNREKEIMELAFGLKDGVYHSYSEIAPVYHVTPSRIEQIQARAMHRAFSKLESVTEGLKGYM